MPDIIFYFQFSLEILTIVAFTMLLSFYVYQSRNRPLVKNRYFVAAIIAGLIAMIAFTFNTLFVEFVKNSQTGLPTNPDRVAVHAQHVMRVQACMVFDPVLAAGLPAVERVEEYVRLSRQGFAGGTYVEE